MNELTKKYRAAPRQKSPDRLDSLVLARAAQHVRGRKASRQGTPWLTTAITCSVVAIGVTLVMRSGQRTPPNPENSNIVVAELDSAVTAGSRSEQITATTSRLKTESISMQQSEGVVVRQDDQFSETTGVNLAESPVPLASPTVADQSNADKAVTEDLAETVSETSKSESLALVTSNLRKSVSAKRNRAEEIANRVDKLGRKKLLAYAASDVEIATSDTDSSVANSIASAEVDTASDSARRNLSSVSAAPESKQIGSSLRSSKRSGQAESRQIEVEVVGKEWVMSKSASRYTIQLAAATDANYLREFAESSGLNGKFTITPSTMEDSDGKSLLFGEYETFEDAQDKLQSLAGRAKQFSPWIRSFKILQQQ